MSKNILIDLKNVSKAYDNTTVVNDISLYIKKGEFVTLLGPSGCGKTTTLRMIAGFEMPTSGTILMDGKEITNVPPHLRPINTVFQRYALFPHLNVFDNIAFGLKLKKIETQVKDENGHEITKISKLSKSEITKKVKHSLKMVGMTDYEYRNVNSLSGGQQQRVAIARAIVNEPKVLLLDEPLGALDLKMRKEMQLELKEMHRKLGITFIYVTHDQEEALTMSDTIVVMKDGIIHQIGTPMDIYNEPKNAFVADFIGESNILDGVMLEDFKVRFDKTEIECTDKGFAKNEKVEVVIRPEDIYLFEQSNKNAHLTGTIISNIFKGMHYEMQVKTDTGMEFTVQDTTQWDLFEKVGLFIKPFDIHIMHKERFNNSIETEIHKNNSILIDGYTVECDLTQLNTNYKISEDGNLIDETGKPVDLVGKKVKAEIEFTDIILTDDEAEGTLGAEVISILFKGDHYHLELKTFDGTALFVDTTDVWDDGDRVGVNFDKENIKLTLIEDESDE